MNANDSQPPDNPLASRLSPAILCIAFFIGIPIYILIAWILYSSGAGHPAILGESSRVVVYAFLAFLGLGSATLSFIVRKLMMSGANAAQGQRPFAALVVGLALSETPAILGVVYFFLSYDWAGFLLLLAASVICFILHARRA